MQAEKRIAITNRNESRGGGAFRAIRRRLWLSVLLSAACAFPQGCLALKEVTREVVGLQVATREDYQPILAPARRAATLESAPLENASSPARPLDDSTATPAPEPPPKPGEAVRPGNPAAWGESGKLSVGRRFDAIYFNGQGTELDAIAKQRLAAYAEWLRARPQVWLTLIGHADRHPAAGYAYNLGMARALAVADYLVGAGLDPRRLFATSFGKDQPAAEEKTPEADALNNRVEVLGFVPPPGVETPQEAGLNKDAAPESETAPKIPAGQDLPRR